jgi:glycosyltransferase involved in cell wall biosynthesis
MKGMNFSIKRIDVIRLGDEINHQKKITNDFLVPENPFILSVGTFEVRKNYELIYQVYKLALQKSIELPMTVIVGRPGWLTNDLKYKIENDPAIYNKIILKLKSGDEELDYLYRNCLFTVYPSLYEGWGLPIAESLAYGKVCLPSETSSMKEIAGPILEYFNPNDPMALLTLLQKYLKPTNRVAAEKIIREKYRVTTWEQTASQFSKLLRQY